MFHPKKNKKTKKLSLVLHMVSHGLCGYIMIILITILPNNILITKDERGLQLLEYDEEGNTQNNKYISRVKNK